MGGVSGTTLLNPAKASRPYDLHICYVYQHRWENLKCRTRKKKALLKRFACRNLSESLRRFIQSDEEVGFWGLVDGIVHGPRWT
jgi:hypothetical protein